MGYLTMMERRALIRLDAGWLLGLAALTVVVLPTWVGLILGWAGVIRYVPQLVDAARRQVAMLDDIQAAQAATTEAETGLDEAIERIGELERELREAQAAVRPAPQPNAPNPLYHRVGLHEDSPDFLVQAARKAFRGRLHPDRHPRHREQAHDRFVRAEQAFDRIYAERGIRA